MLSTLFTRADYLSDALSASDSLRYIRALISINASSDAVQYRDSVYLCLVLVVLCLDLTLIKLVNMGWVYIRNQWL